MQRYTWTEPYFGISHYGEGKTQKRWATVEDWGSFVELLKWFPGCGFNPEKETFSDLNAAKKAGEKFVNG